MHNQYSEIVARRKDAIDRLKRILIEMMNLDLEPDEIAEDAALFGIGLGLDSIDALQFIVGIEKEFDVTLPSEDINVYRSINSVTDFLLANSPAQVAPAMASAVGALAEYEAIRSQMGLTDRSEMVKLKISGEKAAEILDGVVTGYIGNLPENAIRHTLLLDGSGRIITDLQLYNCFDHFILTCPRKSYAPVKSAVEQAGAGALAIEDMTDRTAAISVEGPYAWKAAMSVAGPVVQGLPVMRFAAFEAGSSQALVARYGQTGEYGYLFLVPSEMASDILSRLKSVEGTRLCGRAVHDILQLEGRAFNRERDTPRDETPLQAGLQWMIGFRKPSFAGRDALMAEKRQGLKQKMIGLKMLGPGVPEFGAKVLADGAEAGYIAHGGFSPLLKSGIALAYLTLDWAWVGLTYDVEVPGGLVQAISVTTPFFQTLSMSVRIE